MHDLAAIVRESMGTPKPWWQSRTIIGALVVLCAQGLRLAGLEVDTGAVTDLVADGATVLGALLALWGRVRAERPIRRRVLPGAAAERLPDQPQPPRLPADRQQRGGGYFRDGGDRWHGAD